MDQIDTAASHDATQAYTELAERSALLIAGIDERGAILWLGLGWAGPGQQPERLQDLIDVAPKRGLDQALREARDSGVGRFRGTLARTGHELCFELLQHEGAYLLFGAPVGPGPLAAQAVALQAGAGLALIDGDGLFRFANATFCHIYGHATGALLGQHFSSLLRPDDRPGAIEHHAAILRGERQGEAMELTTARPDGTSIVVDTCGCRVDLPDGSRLHLATAFDITNMRSAQAQLAEAESRLGDIIAAMPGAVYQLVRAPSGAYRLTYMSEGLRRLAGLDADARLADFESVVSLLPPDDAQRAMERAEDSARSLEAFEYEFPVDGPGGRRWVQARSQPHRRGDGTVVWNGLMIDITERRNARAEAERLNAILDSTPDCVAVTDPQGMIQYLNAGGRAMLGLAPDADLGQRCFLEFISDTDVERLCEEATRTAARAGTWSGETTVAATGGELRPVSQTVLCHRDETGRVDRFSTVIRDLSERVAMEAELRASEERYRLLYHHTPTLLHSIDPQGRLTAVSEYWLEHLGYTREQVIGRPSLDFFTPESGQRALEQIRPAFWRDGYIRNVPFQIVRADGEVIDVLLSADCQYGEAGEVVQAISVMADVTERVAAERRLAASEERLSSLYHNTPVMMHSVDPQGRIIDVNDYWLQRLGYARERVVGTPAREFLSPASQEKAWRIDMPRLLEQGYLRDEPLEVVCADGSVRDILLSATLDQDRSGEMLYSRSVMIDVSAQRRAEADYRDIFENATEGIYRSTPQGRLLRANPALAQLHGFNDEAELLANIGDIDSDWYVDPRSRHRLKALLAHQDRVTDFEAEITRFASGERIWTSENVRAIRDRDGEILYYEGTVRDITAQYRAARLAERRGEILEMIARDQPVTGILHEIVAIIEQQYPDLTGAILRLQDGRLYTAAAPSLAVPCIEALDGRQPAMIGGAIAAALAAGEAVPASGRSGSDFARRVQAGGYAGVVAVPVYDQRGAELGVLAAFAAQTAEPGREEQVLLNEMAQITSIAIEQYRLAQQLIRQARYDELTGLPNRALLYDRLEHGIEELERSGQRLAVLLLDLDEFKLVNDTLGHSVGDELLRQVATRLRYQVRAGDTVARLGGDEFVLLVRLDETQEASEIAERVVRSLQGSIALAGQEVHARPSVGISIAPQDGTAPESLLQAADTAMYAAKHGGKNHYRYFAEAMNARITERLRVEGDLRHALVREELVLHFQPQFALVGHALVGLEALVRWQHPQRGLLLPGDFLPVAERSPLIGEVDRYVLARACATLAAWQASGHEVVLGVNISARELLAEDFAALIERTIVASGVHPRGLELEITESVLMHDFELASQQLTQLKARFPGLRVAIDDFGSGYSSLNYLRHLWIDTLKIDRSFVADIDNAEAADTARAIIRTIVELGRSLGLTVVAEGVETATQAELLAEIGCDSAQGFWFQPARDHDVTQRLLEAS